MTPDISLKDYYYNFINDAKYDIEEYTEKLNNLTLELEEVYSAINNRKTDIKEYYNINLNDYIEWTDRQYDKRELLLQKAYKYKNNDDSEHRILVIMIYRYCGIIKQIKNAKRTIELADKRKDIKYSKFRELVTKYYNKVHEIILAGYGYQYGYGIGTYCINRWKVTGEARNKLKLDFAATNRKKKELLAQGAKLYDDKIAAWYKARGIPYDGVDYRVYRTTDHFYDFTFIHSSILTRHSRDFERSEYVNKDYRGKSYQQIADEYVKEEKDIYNLKLDLKYKLNILLYMYPNKYLNFIRNAEQVKYKY